MKKLFVSVLAIAGLVACSQEQTLVQQGPSPVEFGVAGIENATRVDPSIKTETLTGFNVWAWMDAEDGNVLTAEDVEKVGDQWGYANVAYWLPGHNYSFAAVAPMDSANWEYKLNTKDNGEDNTITFKNIDGTEDLIYAFATQSTTNKVDEDYEAVKLVFNHLLSKTKFTFVNGYATANNPIQVRDVQVKVMNAATYSIKDAAWSEVAGEEIALQYGNTEKIAAGDKCAVADERLTIPASKEMSYEVTYTVDVWQGEKKAIDGLVKTTVIKNLELEQGKAYNFVATISPESLNLDAIEFEIVVEKWDEQNMNMGQIEDEVIFVSTIDELQAALDAATGDTTVVLGANLKGNVTVNEIADATIAIYGNDYKFDGTFALVGGSTYGEGTTVLDGINFETAALNGYDAFIYCNEKEGNTRYPDNVTIKNCTFKGTDTAVAAKFRSLKGNLVVENCKAEGIHSMLQLLSCGEAVVLVDGAEVVNCGRGFSLQNSTNTIRNTKVVADSYGVRLEGGADAATTIVKSSIEAVQPVIVRKLTTAGYTVNVDANTVLTTTGDYDVIFTKNSDDEPYVAPAAAFTFNGPADLVVFPEVVVVRTADEMAAALKAETQKVNVKMANDIDLPISSLGQQTGGSGEYKLAGVSTENITIDLNGNELNITTSYWSAIGAKNDNAVFTIKNGSMTSSQTSGTWNSYDLGFANCNYNFENVVFEKAIALEGANKSYNLKNVTITETHDYYPIWVSAKGQNVTIDGLTIESAGRGIKIDEQYVNAPAKVTLNVDNATFKTAKKAAVIVKSVAGAEINWGAGNSIAEVAEDTDFAVWVDEDAAAYADLVVVNGALVKVEGANTQAIATDTELREALKNGNDVVLTEDITTTDADSNGYGATGININGGVFDGNGHTIAVEGATSTWDSAIAIKGGTIKNVTVAKGFRGIFFKNGTEKIVLENVIINGPTYTISCDSAGKQGFEAYNSKFFGWTSYAGTIGTGYFEGCTFGSGAGYNFSRPYAPTTYVNCDFEAGHKIDARAAVSFENCRFNGVALTSENIATLVTGNVQNVVEVK